MAHEEAPNQLDLFQFAVDYQSARQPEGAPEAAPSAERPQNENLWEDESDSGEESKEQWGLSRLTEVESP